MRKLSPGKSPLCCGPCWKSTSYNLGVVNFSAFMDSNTQRYPSLSHACGVEPHHQRRSLHWLEIHCISKTSRKIQQNSQSSIKLYGTKTLAAEKQIKFPKYNRCTIWDLVVMQDISQMTVKQQSRLMSTWLDVVKYINSFELSCVHL